MKKRNILNLLLIGVLFFSSTQAQSQDTYYKLSSVKKNMATTATAVERQATCWSSAGAMFLEAEWLRVKNETVEVSRMDFIHNIYLKKAETYLKSADGFRIGPDGIAYDVIMLSGEYGVAPKSAYMYPEAKMMNSPRSEGEMNAMLYGTLKMVKEQENGEFTDKWKNMYNTSLLRYMGETKMNFTYNQEKFTPMTFAASSGLNMDDYAMISCDLKASMHELIDLKLKHNWAGHQFFNVDVEELNESLKNSIQDGYTVLWYGDMGEDFVFEAENMAIVPVGVMPGMNPDEDQTEIEFAPLPEKTISDQMHMDVFEEIVTKDQEYVLIYGISTDQDGNEYFEAKYVCNDGEKIVNLSESFVKLNTIYLMLNKQGLPAELKAEIK